MKVALVTGASSGLGRGLALALAHEGVKVYAAARRKHELHQLAADGAGHIEPMILDVGDADATYDAVKKLDDRDPLDLVIANAGIGGVTSGKRLEWPLVKRILEVNLLGAAATLSGALPAPPAPFSMPGLAAPVVAASSKTAGTGPTMPTATASSVNLVSMPTPVASSKLWISGLSGVSSKPHGASLPRRRVVAVAVVDGHVGTLAVGHCAVTMVHTLFAERRLRWLAQAREMKTCRSK